MGEPSPQAAAVVQPAASPGAVLVLGGTGLVGRHLIAQLAADGVRVLATTRAAAPPPDLAAGARWSCGPAYDLDRGEGPWPPATTLVSAGPLAALADWLQRRRPPGLVRLVALGSTSAAVKQSSSDPAERALAATLLRAQAQLAAYCEHAGVAWTLLRPTLIWGEGRDRNLSRLAAVAQRRGLLLLPGHATGRRQPIRAAEVAAAMRAALAHPASIGQVLDLPGGETVAYDEMCRRIAAAVQPPARVWRLRGLPLRAAVRMAARVGLLAPAAAAAVLRMGDDLVFDPAPAARVLGLRPAGFRPLPGDFPGT
jgi:nucleoside-diphosphate-sugar epimerase